jgi:hypothetical protein
MPWNLVPYEKETLLMFFYQEKHTDFSIAGSLDKNSTFEPTLLLKEPKSYLEPTDLNYFQ